MGGDVVGQLRDDDGFGIGLFQFHPAADASIAVVVVSDINDASSGKVRVEGNLFATQDVNLGLEELGKVVRHDLGCHANGNAFCPQQEQQRNFGRQPHRFLHPAVVGIDKFGQVFIEKRFARQRRQAAFDVAGRGCLITGKDVTEITLTVNQIAFVGQVDQGVEDGLVAMRVQFHGLADHVGHLVKTSVVHVVQGLQQAALYGLEAVIHIGNGTLSNDVGGVIEEVGIKQLVQFAALQFCGFAHTGLTIRWSMMYCLRSGVFLPM